MDARLAGEERLVVDGMRLRDVGEHDSFSPAAYARTSSPLQFIASTCIAQNAWRARERVSVLTA